MILKTYTHIFTTDLESTVATLKAVHGTEPHLRVEFAPWTLVGIGDVLAAGGTEETSKEREQDRVADDAARYVLSFLESLRSTSIATSSCKQGAI
jgi:hypothetical protein